MTFKEPEQPGGGQPTPPEKDVASGETEHVVLPRDANATEPAPVPRTNGQPPSGVVLRNDEAIPSEFPSVPDMNAALREGQVETPDLCSEAVPLARPATDLLEDKLLLAAPRITFNDKLVPSLGGIAMMSKLGQGGMGAVYHAVHPRLGKEVAIKVLPFHLAESRPDLVRRFLREAQLAGKVESPHLVDVLDVNQEAGIHYIVMDFVNGPTAGQYLESMTEAPDRLGLDEHEALDIMLAACQGLQDAHSAGIVHRDIKPDNIMIPLGADGKPNLRAAVLSDLGLARQDQVQHSLTSTIDVMGSPGYMAPEQALDAKAVSKPADVFSMGATLYALLSGRAPFGGDTSIQAVFQTINQPHIPIRERRAEVSPATAVLVDVCLRKLARNRFADSTQLKEALTICRDALAGTQADRVTAAAKLKQMAPAAEHEEQSPEFKSVVEQAQKMLAPPPVTPTPRDPSQAGRASASAPSKKGAQRPHGMEENATGELDPESKRVAIYFIGGALGFLLLLLIGFTWGVYALFFRGEPSAPPPDQVANASTQAPDQPPPEPIGKQPTVKINPAPQADPVPPPKKPTPAVREERNPVVKHLTPLPKVEPKADPPPAVRNLEPLPQPPEPAAPAEPAQPPPPYVAPELKVEQQRDPQGQPFIVVEAPAVKVDLGKNMLDLKVSPDGQELYAIYKGEAVIRVFETATFAQIHEIQTPRCPISLYVDARRIAVACDESRVVTILDRKRRAAIQSSRPRDDATAKPLRVVGGAPDGSLLTLWKPEKGAWWDVGLYHLKDNGDMRKVAKGGIESAFYLDSTRIFTQHGFSGSPSGRPELFFANNKKSDGLRENKLFGPDGHWHRNFGLCEMTRNGRYVLLPTSKFEDPYKGSPWTYVATPDLERIVIDFPGTFIAEVPEENVYLTYGKLNTRERKQPEEILYVSRSNGRVIRHVRWTGGRVRNRNAASRTMVYVPGRELVVARGAWTNEPLYVIRCGPVQPEMVVKADPGLILENKPPEKTKAGLPFTFKPDFKRPADAKELDFKLKRGPKGLTVDRQTGRVNWTPGQAQLGKFDIEVVVIVNGQAEIPVVSWTLEVDF